MASPIPLILLFLVCFSSASRHRHNVPTSSTYSETQFSDIITQACKASHDPAKCQSSLSQSPQSATTAAQIIQIAVSISTKNLNDSRIMIQNVLKSFTGDKNGTTAAGNCLEFLNYSEYRINLVNDALPRGAIKDARAWMSSVLGYQYGCWSGLKYVNTSSLVAQTMSYFNNTLIASTSDVLGMMASFDVYGEDVGSWAPPRTERDGYWEPDSAVSGSEFLGCVPSNMELNVTVCKSSCDYSTIQDAVNGAPDNLGTGKRFVIRILSGVYEEIVRVPFEKKNVVFLGDGIGKTIITGSLNVGMQGMSTYDSATVGVIGDGFMASDLTIQNTAGPDAHQAVAFRSDSDLSFIENCEFLGNQDTLYAHSLRQYYKSCRIQGNVDFIFGNSASYFQDCLILIAPRQINPEKGETNAVTAHGRIEPGQTTGFVFQNCVINGTDAYMALYYSKPKVHRNFLGRPWKQYSRTIFVGCELEALISPDGWLPWDGDFALQTLYYGEFESGGPGANVSGRVPWSSQVPAEHVQSYSTQNFIQGDHWIPS